MFFSYIVIKDFQIGINMIEKSFRVAVIHSDIRIFYTIEVTWFVHIYEEIGDIHIWICQICNSIVRALY